ncbi:MAG: HAMP domain-containing protein [Nitrospirae bacterium]|nr:HAMP domain-containing protein [Nitrospirota bacterium]
MLEASVATGRHAKELTTSFILNLRRLEKNYMLFRNKESSVKFETALSELKNITPFCIDCSQYVEAINNLLAAYSKIDSKVNELQVLGNNLEEISNKIVQGERQMISSFLTHTQRLILIAVAMLCILGPLFVYTTANYIVAPIKRLAHITRKISEGDVTLRAPLKEHDETYSLAMSFNTMLDHLQLTHESLEKSLELLREKQTQLVESEKLASLGTLASGVAHELNNPLNNIYLASQTLSREIDPATTPDIVKECVKDISSQTLRVKRIVGDLLEFAREKGPELKKINLTRLIKDVLNQMVASGALTGVKHTLKSPSNVDVLADRLLLEQVFINLFSNAVDAMGGAGSLNIGVDVLDDSVLTKISDTGQGIPSEIISKIFDPFFTTKEKGTGLGLAIVYNIIKKHNGKIEVHSVPEAGTAFEITLPKGDESA